MTVLRRPLFSGFHPVPRLVRCKSLAAKPLGSGETGLTTRGASGRGRSGRLGLLPDADAVDRWRLGALRDGGVARLDKPYYRLDEADPSMVENLLFHHISCGKVDLALLLFKKIDRPGVFLWNAMIRACSWNDRPRGAVDLFRCMVGSGVTPNKFTFPFFLKACSGLLALNLGMEVHGRVVRIGLHSDVFISTALLDLYMKCGQLKISRRMFDEMPQRDIVAWNAMIAGCSLHGMHEDTLSLVTEMQRLGVTPNSSTVVALLPTIGEARVLSQVKIVHGFCVRRYMDKAHVLVGTALLDVYAKCLSLEYAEKVFDGVTAKNEVTWSAMIGAYVSCDRMVQALDAFNQMVLDQRCPPTPTTLATILRACARLTDLSRGRQLHGYLTKSGISSDITVGNSLLSMYSKCGNAGDALGLFGEMGTRDTVSYSAIISGCLQNGSAEVALRIFRQMQASSAEPDAATMVGVIPACSHLAALQHGRCSHGYVVVRGLSSDTSVCNALVDMYAKCGRIILARKLFDRMSKRDIVSWNTMMSGYGLHGLGKEALSLFFGLQAVGLDPDDVTFIGVLTACSHSGLVEEGKELFSAMSEKFNLVPRVEHCICMVDLLGRGGFLQEARDFVQKIPFAPDVRVWGALLSACRLHKDVKLGEEVSRMIQKLGPEGTGNFVLLSNIYSAAGRFDEAASVRILRRRRPVSPLLVEDI